MQHHQKHEKEKKKSEGRGKASVLTVPGKLEVDDLVHGPAQVESFPKGALQHARNLQFFTELEY